MNWLAGNIAMIICFVVGTGLIILEGFMPGFGLAGISGIVLEIIAVFLVGARYGVVAALIALGIVLLVAGLILWISYRSAMRGRLSRTPLILRDQEDSQAAPADEQADNLIGRTVRTVTPLRPGGTVEADGVRMEAFSGGEFIDKGKTVTVVSREGARLIVREADA